MHPQTWSLDPPRILTRRELSMVLADAATNADQTPTCSSASDWRFAYRKTKRPRPYRNGQGRRDLLGLVASTTAATTATTATTAVAAAATAA